MIRGEGSFDKETIALQRISEFLRVIIQIKKSVFIGLFDISQRPFHQKIVGG
ncbi:hypothetical protein ZMO1_ZMO0091 [Zymomonas mobilis subsp. mobilis ZM4 = ATCC 31821]|uniref:Uncharacterized protein n=1 Tax=Zymomonas mobilis subsp. mobilis (strain ATCC 31821 / ZM4 / CP4) TaxID=264203 RepID=Q5NRD9_ZYMMO|nr:hypothetical protein ZMO0091 [Zymomonas mobilis subsp. mobilis ZM4 = ATCC 31821]AVZ25122.1 hypothetical protein ZMO2_ZMO0091 [Zymomonas mobilis subsp. mobilis]AVZ27013.1 hypothetical protein ZMO3_ZMO0091 [Zymomonas mobilis subsp. mobilis]AVZ41459.1 hypothetical protein ZMO1_ZMO0091 [Zymomonas mobilis subsp. mobilis ZM4 = ATCC 31821]